MRRNARAAKPHEKDMGSYERFAWDDAHAIAWFIEDTFGANTARTIYDAIPTEDVINFEKKYHELIGDFIQKSESQRPGFLRRIGKTAEEETRIAFVVLALLGVLRAKAIMELRDKFSMELAPGRGNRLTTASLYDFSQEIQSVYKYAWPFEIFSNLDLSFAHDDYP